MIENTDKEKSNLVEEVQAIVEGLNTPPPDVKIVMSKSNDMLLRENVLKTVQDSLSVVSELDEKISSIIQIIFDKIQNTEEKIKIDDLFRFFNILKSYRLNSFSKVIDPFKTNKVLNPDDDGSSGAGELNKLSDTLPSGDLKKLKNLSKNIENFNKVMELFNIEKKEDTTIE
jgi:hypothetical protein